MLDLHFINGHRYNHQGATGHYTTEWMYAMSLHPLLKTPHKYFDAYDLNKYVDADQDTAIALEFHLNSFNSPTIEGYEVLVLANDLESLKYAELFLDHMKKVFPLRRNRGIKFITPNDRGYNNLLRLKQFFKRAMITEAFFLNNPDDWIAREDMARVINRFDKQIS